MATREAACSCGQLHLTAEGDPIRISMCHCLACQRRTGSAFGIQARFMSNHVDVVGRHSDYVRISDEGEKRTFCRDGTPRLKATGRRPSRIAQPRSASYSRMMARIEDRLRELGLALPAPMDPPGNFELVTVHGGVAYVAGHAPIDGSAVLVEGAVGRELTVEEGYRAARLTALSILASLKRALGDLDRVTKWLRAVGYVQAAPGFHDNAKVVNGFSDLIVEVFGDAGRHLRSAPGQGPSPLNVPIIVDAFVAVSG